MPKNSKTTQGANMSLQVRSWKDVQNGPDGVSRIEVEAIEGYFGGGAPAWTFHLDSTLVNLSETLSDALFFLVNTI